MGVSYDARVLAVTLALLAGSAVVRESAAQQPGEVEFQTFCVACHTIGAGRLVGPDLAGVHERRSQQWLERFVASAQSVIDSGDPDAVAVFEEYARLPMPDAPFSAQQIADVLSYVKARGAEVASGAAAEPPPAPAATETAQTAGATEAAEAAAAPSEADILRGQDLFQGRIRLANAGAACNACHEVVNDAVIGGGILAADLTTVFSRMGMPGVGAILGRPPFPVMQAAYENKPLTEDEIKSLLAFLQYADAQQFYHRPRGYGVGLFLSGSFGGGALLVLLSFVWRGRRQRSVNQPIYDRQLRSVWEG